jgi:hypothetical protein
MLSRVMGARSWGEAELYGAFVEWSQLHGIEWPPIAEKSVETPTIFTGDERP